MAFGTHERRWITREEIAEIYDSLAKRALQTQPKLGESRMRHIDKSIIEAEKHKKRAADIRATELLSRPIGDRVA